MTDSTTKLPMEDEAALRVIAKERGVSLRQAYIEERMDQYPASKRPKAMHLLWEFQGLCKHNGSRTERVRSAVTGGPRWYTCEACWASIQVGSSGNEKTPKQREAKTMTRARKGRK